ncbi:hypothetical protein [Furfurilactobacillus curtus]|uniref:Peptidoglycan-binding protein n=1 Tax=Furfurilactobacillus curtus TaxID=1746200 RepID=A0ABQ5JQ29_9LACO
MAKLGMKVATLAAAVTMGSSLFLIPTTGANADDSEQVVLKQLDGSPHNNESFAVTTVAMKGNKILAAKIDEFQFVKKGSKGFTGVPNSNSDFGKDYKSGQMLISKNANDAAYSDLMKKNAKATKSRADSMTAIENYVKGKTASQLLSATKKNKAMQKKVISGATLASTNGYVKAIANAAKKGYTTKGTTVDDDNVVLKQMDTAPHGKQAFAVTTVAMSGDKIAATSIDEFQFVKKGSKDFTGVPNSNAKFGKEGYKSGQMLISKQANDKGYSALMKKEAKSTQSRMKSIKAIDQFAAGKTASDLTNTVNDSKGKKTDVVSGATLVDTNNYLTSIVQTANQQ